MSTDQAGPIFGRSMKNKRIQSKVCINRAIPPYIPNWAVPIDDCISAVIGIPARHDGSTTTITPIRARHAAAIAGGKSTTPDHPLLDVAGTGDRGGRAEPTHRSTFRPRPEKIAVVAGLDVLITRLPPTPPSS
jgi:hypothetical protein